MRKSLLVALVLAFAGVSQLVAGTVYVPVASNEGSDGKLYQTRVWVSNPTGQPHQFSMRFIPSGKNGAAEDHNGNPLTVGAQGTFFLNTVAPEGQNGMLEIDADPQLVFGAELESMNGGGGGTSARMPVISSQNLTPAGGTAELVGLLNRSSGTVSNVGIINLSKEETSCAVRVFQPSGQQVGGTVVLSFAPLSHRQFDAALSLIGLKDVNHMRITTSCDRDFYAYATVFGSDPEETLFFGPSISANSGLIAPGTGPEPVVFDVPGEYLRAVPGNSYKNFQLPVDPAIDYNRIEVEFDFFLGRFNSSLFHTLTSLRSDGLYFVVTLRGSNSKTFLDVFDERRNVSAVGPWRRGRTYRVKVIFDVPQDLAQLEVSQGGVLLQTIQTEAVRGDMGAVGGRSLNLDFSQTKVFDNAFFPLTGSVFSNLRVRVFPAVF